MYFEIFNSLILNYCYLFLSLYLYNLLHFSIHLLFCRFNHFNFDIIIVIINFLSLIIIIYYISQYLKFYPKVKFNNFFLLLIQVLFIINFKNNFLIKFIIINFPLILLYKFNIYFIKTHFITIIDY